MELSQRLLRPGKLPVFEYAQSFDTICRLQKYEHIQDFRYSNVPCRFSEGMEEDLIATIAKDVLQGLEYMHDDGSMHRYCLGLSKLSFLKLYQPRCDNLFLMVASMHASYTPQVSLAITQSLL